MGKAKPVTAAGRARVERKLARHGLLLVQGQWELPSVADLLEGKPIATRGYSWDYVPAWNHVDELAARPDVAVAKLFRGRTTLMLERLWPAVDTLAQAASRRIEALPDGRELRRFLSLVEAEPGVPGGEIRQRLRLDANHFQRAKGALEKRLCIFGVEREDLEHHTHESRWFPWSRSKVATAVRRSGKRPDPEGAMEMLLGAVYAEGPAARQPRTSTLFPLIK